MKAVFKSGSTIRCTIHNAYPLKAEQRSAVVRRVGRIDREICLYCEDDFTGKAGAERERRSSRAPTSRPGQSRPGRPRHPAQIRGSAVQILARRAKSTNFWPA